MLEHRQHGTEPSGPDPSGSARVAPIPVLDLGIVPYEPLLSLQACLREAVADGDLRGVLLLLEHDPVITLGTRGGASDLLATEDPRLGRLPVVRTERGGAATLHAPGQLVSYPILRIPGRDLRAFVSGLEQTLIQLLAHYGVAAVRRQGAPGLYTGGHKIASVGLRCHRWVSSHGTSLNVSNDLGLFAAIVSCGEADLYQTSVAAQIGRAPSMEEVKRVYTKEFSTVFGVELDPPVKTSADAAMRLLGLG